MCPSKNKLNSKYSKKEKYLYQCQIYLFFLWLIPFNIFLSLSLLENKQIKPFFFLSALLLFFFLLFFIFKKSIFFFVYIFQLIVSWPGKCTFIQFLNLLLLKIFPEGGTKTL